MSKVIPLTLATNYVSSWGVWQAVRELIANAIDCGEGNYKVSLDYDEGSITITTYAGTIPQQYLLMGAGSKSLGDGNIGQFNEGLKLAMLVLTRECKEVNIANGTTDWTPSLRYSDTFGTEHLHVAIDEDTGGVAGQVTISVHGMTYSELSEVEGKYLQPKDYGEHFKAQEGIVLLDEKHAGNIYCGGIYVSHNTGLTKGYNFNTKELSLDRDRETVREFDIQYITRKMLDQMSRKVEHLDDVVDMITNNSTDTAIMGSVYSPVQNQDLKEAVFDKYMEEHEGAVLAESYDDKKKLEASGVQGVVFLGNDVFTNIVTQSQGYKELHMNRVIEHKSISSVLMDFRDKYYQDMGESMLDSFDDMVQTIQTLQE